VDVSPILPGEYISAEDLMIDNIPGGTELLLIKTGFQRYRSRLRDGLNGTSGVKLGKNSSDYLSGNLGGNQSQTESDYTKNGPVFGPEIAELLRKACPDIRVVGFDAISLSSFSDRELGRAAHAAFLNHEQPILLLEDMDLSLVNSSTNIKSVVVSPLLVKEADGSLCTILAEVDLGVY
jgi:kynurenine formamidase